MRQNALALTLTATVVGGLIAACGGASDREAGLPGLPPVGSDDVEHDDRDDFDDGDFQRGTDDASEPRGDGPLAYWDLRPGDCFNTDIDARGRKDFSTPPQVVDCDEPHDNEVIDGLWRETEPDDPWPGGFILNSTADRLCSPQFDRYLGLEPPRFGAAHPPALQGTWLIPSQRSWDDGARIIICFMFLGVPPDGGAQLKGSLAGVGLNVYPANLPENAPRPPEGFVLTWASPVEKEMRLTSIDHLIEAAGMPREGTFTAVFSGSRVYDSDQQNEVVAAIERAVGNSGWSEVARYDEAEVLALVVEQDNIRVLMVVEGLQLSYYYLP